MDRDTINLIATVAALKLLMGKHLSNRAERQKIREIVAVRAA